MFSRASKLVLSERISFISECVGSNKSCSSLALLLFEVLCDGNKNSCLNRSSEIVVTVCSSAFQTKIIYEFNEELFNSQ